MDSKLKEMEAQMGNVTISMRGYTFRSLEDCEMFIVDYVPGNTYAHFYDIISLLQRAWGETHVSVAEVWSKLYNMKKAGFTCKGEAVILASMSTILPTSQRALPLCLVFLHTCIGRPKEVKWGDVRTLINV
jgi:hypothetical protein